VIDKALLVAKVYRPILNSPASTRYGQRAMVFRWEYITTLAL
jgi:hypothetical protein